MEISRDFNSSLVLSRLILTKSRKAYPKIRKQLLSKSVRTRLDQCHTSTRSTKSLLSNKTMMIVTLKADKVHITKLALSIRYTRYCQAINIHLVKTSLNIYSASNNNTSHFRSLLPCFRNQ